MNLSSLLRAKVAGIKHKRAIITALVVLLLIYIVLVFMIANGVVQADRIPLEDSPADYGVSFENVNFSARDDDLNLQGWYLRGEQNLPAFILVHGVNVNRTAHGMTQMAALLNEQGFTVLLFDVRAHGESEGTRASGGWEERMDVLGAYDFLRSRGVADVVVLGVSMGAGVASMAAAEEEGIQALILDSSFSSVSDLMALEIAHATPFPGWFTPVFIPGIRIVAPLFYAVPIGKIQPRRKVRNLNYPVLLIHSDADSRIPISHSDTILENAPDGSQIWKISNAAHARAFSTYPAEYIERISNYALRRFD